MDIPKMTDMTQMAKQLFEFQKATFSNVYSTITMVQDQAETFGTTFIEQNPALPQQTKDAVNGWLNMCKKARDDYKKALDDSFKDLEGYFSSAAKGKGK
ncbi:MAG: hypothetical protein GXP53_05455 [Deltaproteobacteria bacterium]|nr:hypothetical protein [Deltaproteobacteria bacterium]